MSFFGVLVNPRGPCDFALLAEQLQTSWLAARRLSTVGTPGASQPMRPAANGVDLRPGLYPACFLGHLTVSPVLFRGSPRADLVLSGGKRGDSIGDER